MTLARILDVLGPLSRALDGRLSAPATLRLWDHVQQLELLAAQPFAHAFPVPLPELEESYRRARELIALTTYEELRDHVDAAPAAPLARTLAALVDWKLDDVRRWSARSLTLGLAAAARAEDPAGVELLWSLSRQGQARPEMPMRPAAWELGNEAWLVLIEHGRIDPRALAADLMTFWTAGEHSRRAYGRLAALPPSSRERLDRALTFALSAPPFGELHRLLASDYGPTRADALLLSLVEQARPRDMGFPYAGSVGGALARLDAGDEVALARALASVDPGPRLCAASLARPSVLRALAASFGGDEAAPVLAFMRETFPPRAAIPRALMPKLVTGLSQVALGLPGDSVSHGLMPSRVTKLARLLLAANGHVSEEQLVRAARAAYTQPRYAAHDAVACLLVSPLPDPIRRACLEELAPVAHDRGHRLRAKWHALLRWRGIRCPADSC